MCGSERFPATGSYLLPSANTGCRHGHAYPAAMRRVFFAPDARSNLCSERCRKASKKAAKKSFDSKSREEEYEQAYKREYMFWYNRIKKLEKNHASQEQIQRAKNALRQFRKEAVERKKQIQNGTLSTTSTTQFINWMIGQEPIIQEICGE